MTNDAFFSKFERKEKGMKKLFYFTVIFLVGGTSFVCQAQPSSSLVAEAESGYLLIKENVQEPVQSTVQVQEQPQIIPTETNIPVQQNQTTVIQQPVQPENQTVKVDTQTTVVENNTDDEYFDDFFE